MRFKDAYIAHALGAFAKLLDDVGLGEVARFHNLPPGDHGLYNLRRIQGAIGGPVGIDAYTPRARTSPSCAGARLACAGNAAPVPIAFEVGVGFFPWFPPLDRADDPLRERDHLLTLLASGIRGFNLFMAVERDRYYGAAIGAGGEGQATWIAPLLRALERDRVARAAPARRRSRSIDTRADARFGIASERARSDDARRARGARHSRRRASSARDPGAIAARRWRTADASALELAQVPYAIVDESAPEDELARYRAVIVPTHGARRSRPVGDHPAPRRAQARHRA